ncbi:MAG: glycosyltransferase family 4 protein [Bacteroidales bacterium]|nr:glycosyltransferase family 4 protein [Bacteroidales bacterium]
MRVLMFGWEFPPHIAGGLGTACYGMTKGLAENGVEVLFVMPSASGDEDQSAVRILNASDVPVADNMALDVDKYFEKVQFYQIGTNMIPYADPDDFAEIVENERMMMDKNYRIQYGKKYKFSGKYGANLMEEVARYAMAGATLALEHKDEFDVIHAHDWLTYMAGVAAKKVTGKPLVVHMHATSFDRGSEKNIDTRVYSLERRGMEAADKVIAVSELTRNICINKYGIPPEKVVAVHNAVDFSGKEAINVERGIDDKIVTFLGRITYQKGPEYFIEAAAKVLKRCPNVRFVMAGSGDLMDKCVLHVARLGLSDRFHFTGFLRGAAVTQMFALSDVYVMPSISEPFGISPLEAMQTNVPSIVSKQSGCAEILDYCLKVDFWDVDAMADAIYGLLQYPAVHKLAQEKGYEEVNNLKWTAASAKIKAVYESVL